MTDRTEKLLVGPMLPQELAEFERIDRDCFPTPWPAAEFKRFMESGECTCISGRLGERSVGYGVMLFE